MYGNSHSQGTCVLLEIPFIHKLVQYFQRPYSCRNEDIIYTSLKVYVLPTLKLIFVQEFLNTVVHLSNVNSLYQCSCKQCCAIAVYAMCYSVINPSGYWTLELYLPLLVMGIHCTMWWEWKTYYPSWSSWKWEYQWNWDKPYCLRRK